MNRFLIILSVLIVPYYCSGQLYTMTDHYMHNALAVNPAYAGSHDALSSIISYRSCLKGFEGAPSTMIMSVHAPLNNDRVGAGLFLMNDKYGVTSDVSFIGNYAYRMNVGYGKLSLGLGFGMILSNTEWNALAAHDEDDELLSEESATGVMPDFSVGIYYSTRKYFVGMSLPLFLSHEYDTKADKFHVKNKVSEYNYLLNAGYIIDLGSSVKYFPSVLLKYNQNGTSQIDVNSQFIFNDRVWAGVAYRSKNLLVGMLQCQINRQLRIAYSYDFVMGESESARYNAHEIMLNYVLVRKVVAANPRQF